MSGKFDSLCRNPCIFLLDCTSGAVYAWLL